MADAVGAENGGHEPHQAAAGGNRGTDAHLAELRSILVGPERRELRALQDEVRDPVVHTEQVSRVLPDALEQRARDPRLMRALAPSIEQAITASVQRDPQPLADALFPVIGPAIRRAVAHSVEAMLETVNRTIEHSVSSQALRWRWTAWRTGKSFAEIVLLNTIEYRVEQVFLIHRETGLLLQQVAIDSTHAQDADQISAMLTAIRDFARDSFQVASAESLESLRVGDLAVIIEQGPYAVLAAVIRGVIPAEVRAALQDALDSVHRQYSRELKAFAGDASAFAAARPILEACLLSQARREHQRGPSPWRWAAALAVVVVAIGVWALMAARDRQRWNSFVERLDDEPGIVVLASGREDGRLFVAGLRDPLAVDPEQLIAAFDLAAQAIDTRWEPYESQHPSFVTARAVNLLRPPAGVALAYGDGVLTARGSAPGHWIADSARLAPALAGVRDFRFVGQSIEEQLVAAVSDERVLFAKGATVIAPEQEAAVERVVAGLRDLDTLLASGNQRVTVEVVGHADSDGPDHLNDALSAARAEQVAARLRLHAFDRVLITARGAGRPGLATAAATTDQQRDRRVEFRVRLTNDARPGRGRS